MKDMKFKNQSAKRNRLILPTILCVTSLLVNACTTQGTAYTVQTQPMSVDLEKQVLRETGISGAFGGALVGAAVGAGLGALLAAASGGDADSVRKAALIGGGLGAVSGGTIGYQKGQQKGQEIVAKAMGRDKLDQLLKGAKAHNQHLASYNAGLRQQIANVKKISDPKEKKLAYTSLRNQSTKELRNADSIIESRTKALDNPAWKNSEKSEYRSQKNDLVKRKNDLVAMNNQMAKLEQSIVY